MKKILTLSECSQAYAKAHLPTKTVGTILVEQIAWSDVVADAISAGLSTGNVERRLLRELYALPGVRHEQKDSDLVYVVSLASRTEKGWTTSWIDIVMKYSRYFHPMRGSWPKDPLNYMGFRYKGKLQSIHHVDDYEVVENLKNACPGIPDVPVDPPLQSKKRPRRGAKKGFIPVGYARPTRRL